MCFKKILVALAVVGAIGCGGSGGGGSSRAARTAFVFASDDVTQSQPNTLYFATVGDPSHPVALRTLGSVNDTFLGAAIDPATGKVYYTDSADTDIHVVNSDGTGDQVFFNDPNRNGGVGFMPNGKLQYFSGGNSWEVDTSTKAATQTPQFGTIVEPTVPFWNASRSEFTYFWFDAASGHFQVHRMVVADGTNFLVADNANGGQFTSGGTVLSPDAVANKLDRFSVNGNLLASYPVQRPFDFFFQVDNTGFLENGTRGPAGDTNINYYRFDGSGPINMTPTISTHVELFDATQLR